MNSGGAFAVNLGDMPFGSFRSFDPLRFAKPSARVRPREALIAEIAYFRAQRRGFAPGHEEEDWLAAEAEVDGRFNGGERSIGGERLKRGERPKGGAPSRRPPI